ncbi:motility associated factor glycosyltransferase family protein [uncultured Brevibacillus sp.]|uniref:motility associated factor glycosyltransferase family protein n=1 Tax=uncultured Brevibacillus sp. TaxID=169970 RepID=UPI002598D907|nr:6-hydroxymethylpterin diphosphokinase MptE-like protein [uncultured Brevibacillus sp.]
MSKYEIITGQADNGSQLYIYKSEDKILPLNSKISPKKEITKLLKKEIEKQNKITFIVGIGNGEIVNVLHSEYQDIPKVVIIEPFDEVVLSEETFDKIKTSKNIEFFHLKSLLPVTITSIIEEFRGLSSQIIIHPKYDQTDRTLISEAFELIEKSLDLFIINNNTVRFFQKNWIIEPILNLLYTYEMDPIDPLIEKFKDKGAILVSSGPSLTDNIEFIRKAKDHLYIFCVGSALRALLKHDIQPDFVVSIDSSLTNYEAHFKETSYTGTAIFDTMTHHLIVENHKGTALKILSELDGISGSIFPEMKQFIAVASVAVSTLNIIAHFGFEDVYLVGQDLSFVNKKYYADGITVHEGVRIDEELLVDSNNGEKVVTSETLYAQIGSFNQLTALLRGHINMFNLSEKGAKIDNVPYMHAEDVPYQKYEKDISFPVNQNKMSSKGKEKAIEVIKNLHQIFELVKAEEKKINKIHKDVVNMDDISTLLKSVKKIRKEPLVEGALINQLIDDVQRISNHFEYHLTEKQTTNEHRKEMRDLIHVLFTKLKDYLEILLHDEEIQKLYSKG